ncbi:hypothetical protein LEN26_003356 [Aphanomyces euteiches]|nr:hypothetical protein AeMF1_016151 [Aphanomyces euteiches]KAH9154771.1 hypothetical protein LEN26_003356 [Aphanomyces euteiches]KAH9185233.1 hypothetical protein AeNC1_012789 [Aphanomyces euteiches]
MASIYEGTFDTAALQKELAIALEEDRKYKKTDEMKKRAIHTAASYDEFRNFVLCADLKPVSSKDLQNLSKSDRRRNRMYQTKPNNQLDASRAKTLSACKKTTPPDTSGDFLRTWRRSCPTHRDKYQFMRLTTPARFQKMFASELEADLMIQLIECMSEEFENINPANDIDDFEHELDHVGFTVDMLDMMVSTGRFNLILTFFDANQAEKVARLFELAQQAVETNAPSEEAAVWTKSLQELRARFQVS